MVKPYLISIYSYTPGVDRHFESLINLADSVEPINVNLNVYPGHSFRWDYIPKDLDRNRVFIFTDTADVIFQKPIPALSPDYIYVTNENEIFQNNSFWRAVIRRYPQFHVLDEETIYNAGSFACSGVVMDRWVSYIQNTRTSVRSKVGDQLLFNQWVRLPENISLIKKLPDLFTSLYANLDKGTTILTNNGFTNQKGNLYSVVHFNGYTKELLNTYNPNTLRPNNMDTLKYILEKFQVDINKPSTPATIICNRLTDLPVLFKELGFQKGAEVGVLGGVYSEILCQSNPKMSVFSVDAWEFYPVWRNFRRPKHYPAIYEDAKTRLAKYPNSTIIKKWSMDAVKDFADESLDFVFIDADHRFEAVTNDIAEWSKKVRKGGIISGHDYGIRREYVHVTDVVDAWTKSHNIKPWFILSNPDNRHDTGWMWVKL